MKTKNLTATLLLAFAFTGITQAHEGVELGPNGGRILEFSDNETMHGEVTAKDGQFHIAVLDKDLKPVAIKAQHLTATSGDRANPAKLDVTVKDDAFVVPMMKGEDFWVIFQFQENDSADKVTARLHYNAENCSGCDSPEWLCKCKDDQEDKK